MSFEAQLLDAINAVRSNPKQFAERIKENKKYFSGKIWKHPDIPRGIETAEGEKAYDDAIMFLKNKAKPVPKLVPSKGLCQMAGEFLAEYQRDQNAEPDLDAAIDRYGKVEGYIKRLVEYGAHSPEQVVINLVVGDGDKGRGLRDALLLKDLATVGVASGPHEQMRSCTVIVGVTKFINTNDSNDLIVL
jgi:hypothetical protein